MTLSEEKKEEREEPYKDYVKGSGQELYIVDKPPLEVFYYDHENKKKYPFKIKELKWHEGTGIINESMRIIIPADGGDAIPELNIQKVEMMFFLAMVVEHPFAPDTLEMAYYKLPLNFRNWFSQFLPEIGYGLSKKERGE